MAVFVAVASSPRTPAPLKNLSIIVAPEESDCNAMLNYNVT